MSLMNDALRKKRKEKQTTGKSALFQDQAAAGKHRPGIVAGGVLGVLVCLCIAGYFTWQYLSLGNTGLTRSQPPPPTIPTPRPIETQALSPADEPPPLEPSGTNAPAAADPADSTQDTASQMPAAQPSTGKAISRDAAVEPPVSTQAEPEPALSTGPTATKAIEFKNKTSRKLATKAIDPPEQNEPTDKQINAGASTPALKAQSAPPVDPTQSPFFRKAVSYHRQGAYQKAASMYAAVIDQHPDHWESRFNLASAYLAAEAYAQAYEMLRSLHAARPDNPETTLNLALAMIGLDRSEEAVKLLEQSQGHLAAPTFEIYLHKGVAESKMADYDKALFWYREAQKKRPHHPGLLLNMAIAYDNLQQYEQAVAHYRAHLQACADTGADKRVQVVKQRVQQLNAYLERNRRQTE